jgi:hypothetical protein
MGRYILTPREMEGHECFVGITNIKGESYLQEAGTNCERGLQPMRYVMRMKRVAQCYHKRQYNSRVNWNRPTSEKEESEHEIVSGSENIKMSFLPLHFLFSLFVFQTVVLTTSS